MKDLSWEQRVEAVNSARKIKAYCARHRQDDDCDGCAFYVREADWCMVNCPSTWNIPAIGDKIEYYGPIYHLPKPKSNI